MDLGRLFRAQNVALVGASEKSAWADMIAKKAKDFGHRGKIFAVNRAGAPAFGLPGFRSLKEIGEPVDLAYIMVPAAFVAQALNDIADAGIKAAVVLTSGFAEVGEDGAARQADLVAAAKALGLTFMGPNSLGFANLAAGSAVTTIGTRTPPILGGIAVVSQSGATANEIAKFAHQQGFGLSFVCATGNEAMVTLPDVIDYLVDDEATKAIVVYAETISHPDRLKAAALRALERRKPIVMLKIGSGVKSAETAKAHTGGVVGDDRIFEAVCRQFGIIRVRSIEEMLVTAKLVEQLGPLERPGVALVSVSGGACAMFSDLADACGVPMPDFAPATVKRLREVLPSYATPLNPLDITGALLQDPELWERVIPAVAADPEIGLTLALYNFPGTEAEAVSCRLHWRHIGRAFAAAGKPSFLFSALAQPMNAVPASVAREAGIENVLFSLDFGARALGHLSRWSTRVRQSTTQPAQPAPARPAFKPLTEREVLTHLAAHGAPVSPARIARSAAEAEAAAEAIGGAVVLKVLSPDIAHKTEVGGVRLNVTGAGAARRAYESIMASVAAAAPQAKIDGVIVAPMRSGGHELLVGVLRDPQWGPAIAVGLGGIWVEILKDSVVRLLPVDRATVREMLTSLRAAPLFEGYRGSPPVDLDRLADAIVAIGDAAIALGPELAVLEVNPLWVNGAEMEALDGLAVWRETAKLEHA
jgi:acyl-CoA synthetase (NDP forming)